MGLAFSLAMVDIMNIYREKKNYETNKDYIPSNQHKINRNSNENKIDKNSTTHTFNKPIK